MDEILVAMGLRAPGLFRAIITPLLLTCFLFLGPLAMSFPHTLFRRDLSKLIAIRNLIVAPLTEELWFRSGLVSYLLASGVPLTTCLWMSPILFAMSHVHHVYDLIVHQSWHPVDAIMACLGQAGYTTVFGWYATFVYLRTGHLSAVICLHAFCNHMGFPQFGAISRHPRARFIATAYAIGIAIFAVGLLPLTNPALYAYPSGTSYASQFDR